MPDYGKFEKVLVRQEGRLLTLTLNRPHALNALGDGMHQELEEIVKLVHTDDSVGAILLHGEGRGFSAGGDIKEMAVSAVGPSTRAASVFRSKELLYNMLQVEQPIVAAVHGFAIGLGASIALFCDIVVAAEDAFFADTHVNIGVVAGDGGAVLWPLVLPFGVAKYHLLTGDRISGSDAARYGMVYKAVPADKVLEEATAIAQRLADGPSLAIRFTKTAVNQVLRERLNLVLDIGLALSGITYTSEDHREAARAFTEKRDPVFRGQ
jgi:enoyl-CoA hydratase